jgi:endonuclease/exonuclease/phosphatase family metal-dependent hydrolase
MNLVAAHLGLWWGDRRIQLARLQAQIASLEKRPTIVLGDFNDVRRRGPAERSLCPPLTATPALGTFPSWWPILPLDRIWYGPPLEIVSIVTLNEAHHVSDHLPLLASFRLP